MDRKPERTRPLASPPGGDPWSPLRALTAARIGLARAGASLATVPRLDLRLAHARARDAVHEPLHEVRLGADITKAVAPIPVLMVASAAEDRQRYLMRPDLGRRLAPGAESALAPHAGEHDLALVVADGLSARAVQTHAGPVLARLLPRLAGWQMAPVVIVRHGRVAIGDAVATALGAACTVVLIGERPGLTAPDSMGAYLTWRPGPGTTDADRNCVSNIRPDGIGYADAAVRLAQLLAAMRTRRLSGVRLKDRTDGRTITDG